MEKVAYIYNQHLRRSQAGTSIAQGFEAAFKRMGYRFETFDLTSLRFDFLTRQRKRLLQFSPDYVFASVENIHRLPLEELPTCSLVLWGQFYEPCYYEKQIVTISSETKKRLVRFRDRHKILIWSQHSNAINERFFGGYKKELGLSFLQLLHCANKDQLAAPLANPDHDFIWIGNIRHRQDVYNQVVAPLKQAGTSFVEFTERNPISPADIFKYSYYRNAFVSINVHTKAQLDHRILLNERVFSSTMQGGFQICDNVLAREYFTEEELVIASKPSDYRDYLLYFKSNPTERVERISRMQKKLLAAHLYEHRIRQIIEAL